MGEILPSYCWNYAIGNFRGYFAHPRLSGYSEGLNPNFTISLGLQNMKKCPKYHNWMIIPIDHEISRSQMPKLQCLQMKHPLKCNTSGLFLAPSLLHFNLILFFSGKKLKDFQWFLKVFCKSVNVCVCVCVCVWAFLTVCLPLLDCKLKGLHLSFVSWWVSSSYNRLSRHKICA